MKTLSVSLFFVLFSNAYAEDLITPNERFIDSKTNKLVRVCEVNGNDLVVKEQCGKFWEAFPRKREEIFREVNTFKDINKEDLALFPIREKDGSVKMYFGVVANLYENGRVHMLQSETKKTGFSKGATHFDFDSKFLVKLDKKHPLLANEKLCAKEDMDIVYSYNESHKYSVKKGESVILKGIFENQTAVISLESKWNNFWGYGLNNQLTVDLAKLEVCEGDKKSVVVDDTSRSLEKEKAATEETTKSENKSEAVAK